MSKVINFLKVDKVKVIVDYGLILALVCFSVISAIKSLGGNLKNVFNIINKNLGNVSD